VEGDVGNKMKTLVVYGSRYGATKTIAGWIAERLELDFDTTVEDVKAEPSPEAFDLIIIGSGVYTEAISKEIRDYIDKYLDILENKQVVLYAVCLDTKGVYLKGKIYAGWEYLMPIIKKFKNPPLYADLLHGEINPNKLTPEDYQKLMLFYNKIFHRNYTEVPYTTKMDKQEVWTFVEHILSRLKGGI